jgi:VIT1/CCC1 family predicted Fe2+/Mn2+ transporter
MTDARPLKPLLEHSRRVLSPLERFGEAVFGLIMVLTITGSLSVAEAGHVEIRTMLVGAVGCNLAWGIIDAVMYLLAVLLDRGRGRMLLNAVRTPAMNDAEVRALVADALPLAVASVLKPSELDDLRQRLAKLPERSRSLTAEDFRGSVAVFLLVFLSTFPVVLPFLLLSEVHVALRVSNAIGVVLLFLSGWALARFSGLPPLRFGLAMAAIGAALVAMTMALGG